MEQSRQEAIEKAAKENSYQLTDAGPYRQNLDYAFYFREGAEWADENPAHPLSSWVDVKDAMPEGKLRGFREAYTAEAARRFPQHLRGLRKMAYDQWMQAMQWVKDNYFKDWISVDDDQKPELNKQVFCLHEPSGNLFVSKWVEDCNTKIPGWQHGDRPTHWIASEALASAPITNDLKGKE